MYKYSLKSVSALMIVMPIMYVIFNGFEVTEQLVIFIILSTVALIIILIKSFIAPSLFEIEVNGPLITQQSEIGGIIKINLNTSDYSLDKSKLLIKSHRGDYLIVNNDIFSNHDIEKLIKHVKKYIY